MKNRVGSTAAQGGSIYEGVGRDWSTLDLALNSVELTASHRVSNCQTAEGSEGKRGWGGRGEFYFLLVCPFVSFFNSCACTLHPTSTNLSNPKQP